MILKIGVAIEKKNKAVFRMSEIKELKKLNVIGNYDPSV